MYRDPKKGGTFRKNLLMRNTNMLLFKGETEEPEANNTQVSQLHFTGIAWAIARWISIAIATT